MPLPTIETPTYELKLPSSNKKVKYRPFLVKEEKILMALTKRQEATLKRHSEHHTKKHMTEMRKMMRAGKTFTAAHKAAMKKVGK